MTSQSPDDLQFDSAEPAQAATHEGPVCAACGDPIRVYYYEAEGRTICRKCKAAHEGSQGAASPSRALIGAVALGALGAIVGAAIYLGIAFFTGYEVGLIAILVGFIVGKAVFVGSGRTGGRRYQVLATALTYLAISVTYVPQMLVQMSEESDALVAAATDSSVTAPLSAEDSLAAQAARDSAIAILAESLGDSAVAVREDGVVAVDAASVITPGGVAALAGIVGVMLVVAPVRVVMADFPGSLLSLVIIGVGLIQAWQGARRQRVELKGPFKLTEQPAAEPGTA